MSASRRFPRSRFQPGIAAMYACTGASPSPFAICGLPPERRTTGAFPPAFGGDLDRVADSGDLLAGDVFLAGEPFRATAALTSARNASALTVSPSWMSIARRVLPPRLELKRRDGSGTLAPRAK